MSSRTKSKSSKQKGGAKSQQSGIPTPVPPQPTSETFVSCPRTSGDHWKHASNHTNIGLILTKQGDYHTAQQYNLQALETSHLLGNKFNIGQGLHNLSLTYYFLEEYETAYTYIEEAQALAQDVNDPMFERDVLETSGKSISHHS